MVRECKPEFLATAKERAAPPGLTRLSSDLVDLWMPLIVREDIADVEPPGSFDLSFRS
jgi:hypothetical protein